MGQAQPPPPPAFVPPAPVLVAPPAPTIQTAKFCPLMVVMRMPSLDGADPGGGSVSIARVAADGSKLANEEVPIRSATLLVIQVAVRAAVQAEIMAFYGLASTSIA